MDVEVVELTDDEQEPLDTLRELSYGTMSDVRLRCIFNQYSGNIEQAGQHVCDILHAGSTGDSLVANSQQQTGSADANSVGDGSGGMDVKTRLLLRLNEMEYEIDYEVLDKVSEAIGSGHPQLICELQVVIAIPGATQEDSIERENRRPRGGTLAIVFISSNDRYVQELSDKKDEIEASVLPRDLAQHCSHTGAATTSAVEHRNAAKDGGR